MKIILCVFLIASMVFCLSASNDFKVTILYDNTTYTEGTLSNWGFSCLVEGNGEALLFDAGTRPHTLAKNAEILQVDLQKIKKVMISHNHEDHYGGLTAVLKNNPGLTVFIPPNLLSRVVLDITSSGGQVIKSASPQSVGIGMRTTGIMGESILEQGLILSTGNQNILITGCAHPGVVDLIRQAKRVTNQNIDVVLGGFHLMSRSKKALRAIIQEFKDLGVVRVGATHCTGKSAIKMFKEAYGEDFLSMGVGKILEFH